MATTYSTVSPSVNGDYGLNGDTVDYSHAPAGPSDVSVSVSLRYPTAEYRWAGIDTLINIENLRGSAVNDTLTGETLGNGYSKAGSAMTP